MYVNLLQISPSSVAPLARDEGKVLEIVVNGWVLFFVAVLYPS